MNILQRTVAAAILHLPEQFAVAREDEAGRIAKRRRVCDGIGQRC